ncbi:MAG: hypothetical protein H0U86_02155, partial [Chloroflexi bacterium]|nr:hypothetical protein [Chloroflexota bacterium]
MTPDVDQVEREAGAYSTSQQLQKIPTAGERRGQVDTIEELAPTLPPEGGTEKLVVLRSRDQDANITFINDGGEWTIFLRCFGPSLAGRTTTHGPGYVAVYKDTAIVGPTNADRANVMIVDGRQDEVTGGNARRHIQDAGGLGLFGLHHARGAPGTVAASGFNEAGFPVEARGGKQFFAIEGQRCVDPEKNYSHDVGAGDEAFQHRGYGVRTQRLLSGGCQGPEAAAPNWRNTSQCQFINQKGIGVLDMEVVLADHYYDTAGAEQLRNVVRLTYRWRFHSESVKMWLAVEPLATDVSDMRDPYHPAQPAITGRPYVKEPKLVASLLGTPPGYRRMLLFQQPRTEAATSANVAADGAMRGGKVEANLIGTENFYSDVFPWRARVRWGYAGAGLTAQQASAEEVRNGGPERDNCPKATDTPTRKRQPCFSVLMRAYDPNKVLSGDLSGASLPWQMSSTKNKSGAGGSIETCDNPVGRFGFGLDQWACDEQSQERAYAGDTCTEAPCRNNGPGNPA